MLLGEGSYGQVSVHNGQAVKKFKRLPHLIQEYTALRYLHDCHYVVQATNFEPENLTMTMQLYDGSLRDWLNENRQPAHKADYDRAVLKIFHDIIMGLIELHDRGLAHGDLKPGNVLIKKSPLKAVLGDCGFVSIAKYARVENTAAVYRDPDIHHDQAHDMFSLGICMLEIFGHLKIRDQHNGQQLLPIIQKKIKSYRQRKLIRNLVQAERDKRPNAREVLYFLFEQTVPHWQPSETSKFVDSSSSIEEVMTAQERAVLRNNMRRISLDWKVERGKRGYGALLVYLTHHLVAKSEYTAHIYLTMMVLSALFGRGRIRIGHVVKVCKEQYSTNQLYTMLKPMLADRAYVNFLLAP